MRKFQANITATDVFKKRVETENGKIDWSEQTKAIKSKNFLDMVNCSQKMSLCNIPTEPIAVEQEVILKRISLLREELQEFEDAVKANDVVGQFDGLNDLLFVTYGTISELGFSKAILDGFVEVSSANYTKARENGIYNVNGVNTELNPEFPLGKFLKDKKFYQEPNLVKVLFKHTTSVEGIEYLLNSIFQQEPTKLGNLIGYEVKEGVTFLFDTSNMKFQVGESKWTKDVVSLLEEVHNVHKYAIVGEERGYVDSTSPSSTDQAE